MDLSLARKRIRYYQEKEDDLLREKKKQKALLERHKQIKEVRLKMKTEIEEASYNPINTSYF